MKPGNVCYILPSRPHLHVGNLFVWCDNRSILPYRVTSHFSTYYGCIFRYLYEYKRAISNFLKKTVTFKSGRMQNRYSFFLLSNRTRIYLKCAFSYIKRSRTFLTAGRSDWEYFHLEIITCQCKPNNKSLPVNPLRITR